MNVFAQSLVGGVLIGGLYATMSIGVSLVWGALRLINLVLLGITMVAGYLAYDLAVLWGWDPLLAAVVVVPVMAVASFFVQWLFEAMKLDEFQSLLVTFGILTIAIAAVKTRWSADFRQIPRELNPYVASSLSLGDLAFPLALLIAFVIALGIGVGTHLLLERSMFGKAVRAVAQDRDIAQVVGVDYRRLSRLLSAGAGGISGLAGVFVAILQALHPNLAVEWFGVVFSVVILGGIGSALGSLIAGVVIGAVGAAAAVLIGAAAAPLATFLVLILTLLIRPQGLLGGETGG
ncbi:MAG: branched-chain amino acid ABC transporter permease [Acidimicrobiia bacterium]|nr:MAG: branched-chain amino acid ABC transporter permease [Acidimicrobiia bacterium]